MPSVVRHSLLIAVVGAIVMFTNLGGPRLWDRDEPRNAGCTAEMLERGDWVTPMFNGELRTHKPILLYWFMMTAYAAFGAGEFAARFWSALLAIGTAWLTYCLGRRLFSPAVGLWAGVILLTTLMFDVAGRAATPDSVLIFWITAALWLYVWGTFPSADEQLGEQAARTPERLFPSWPVSAAMYACMGMAVLAKGPVGLVLPTAVIGMFLLIMRLPESAPVSSESRVARIWVGIRRLLRPFAPVHFLRTCWLMRPLTAIVVALAVALPWYLMVGLRTDGEWLRGFLLVHNLGRAAQPMEGHGGWFFYYPLALLVGFFPWSVFAAPMLIEIGRRLRSVHNWFAGSLFACCWVGVYVGLFSIAQTKLPSYITPCYPALALVGAVFIDAWLRGLPSLSANWNKVAFTCLGLIGLAITVGIPIAAYFVLPGDEWLAVIGLLPLSMSVACFVFTARGEPRRAAVCFAVGAVLFSTSMVGGAAARVDRHQHFDRLVDAVYARSKKPQIGVLGVMEPSWVVYLQQPVERLFVPELEAGTTPNQEILGQARTKDWQEKPLLNLWNYAAGGSDNYIITTEQYLRRVGQIPDGAEIIAEVPYFLQQEQLLLLRCGPAQTARKSATGSWATVH
jgi:4-amino-4-deoxy-L-arabinose transferase-like glycosyltransferase